MTSNTDKLLLKIKKLVALADSARNTSEAEAQAAAAKVQELLQEHGLSMAMVESAGGSSDSTLDQREKSQTDRRAMYSWQRSLMAALARNNFCLHAIRQVEEFNRGANRKSNKHFLVGRSINIEVTLTTYDYISTAIRRLADQAGYPATATGQKDRGYFLEGAVSRLSERLDERRWEAERESARKEAERAKMTGGTALVLSNVYGTEEDLNNDAINDFPPGTTAARRRERAEKEAKRAQVEEELIAAGVEKTEAFYRSHGYGEDLSRELAANWNKKSKSRRRSSGRNWTRRWTSSAASDKHAQKVGSAAYNEGRRAGNNVGLDRQVGGSNTKVIK